MRRVLLVFLLLFSVVRAAVHAQTGVPTETAPSPPSNEPALPTDPTAPSSFGAQGTSAIPLIPTQPLSPLPSTPAPSSAGAPAASDALRPDLLGLPTPAPTPEASATTNNIGTARRFQYNVALTLGATFDDNIFLEPAAAARSDVYFTIQPSVSLGFGGGNGGSGQDNLVRFRYSPQVLLYINHPELDTVQHFVTLTGVYHFSRVTLTGAQDVQILDGTDVGNPHPYATATGSTPTGGTDGTTVVNTPSSNVNLDVGERHRLNLYNTSLAANYYVSDKVSYDLSGQFSISDYSGDLISSRTLSGSLFFNYSPTGKTTLGVGTTAGYVFADQPDPDQSFEQANLRLTYIPSTKLLVAAQLGLEFRQSSADDKTQITPVFGLSASYSPFDGTSISLDGNRQVQTSAVLGGQDYTTTSFNLGLNQRFFQRMFARINVGYAHSEYTSRNADVSANRTDDYFFVQPALDFNFRDNIVGGLYYNHRASTSTLRGRDFSDNQVGSRLSITY